MGQLLEKFGLLFIFNVWSHWQALGKQTLVTLSWPLVSYSFGLVSGGGVLQLRGCSNCSSCFGPASCWPASDDRNVDSARRPCSGKKGSGDIEPASKQVHKIYWIELRIFNAKINNLTINNYSIDCVLGTRTRGGRMRGAHESTELWWHNLMNIFYFLGN